MSEVYVTCEFCGGSGVSAGFGCPNCKGLGVRLVEETPDPIVVGVARGSGLMGEDLPVPNVWHEPDSPPGTLFIDGSGASNARVEGGDHSPPGMLIGPPFTNGPWGLYRSVDELPSDGVQAGDIAMLSDTGEVYYASEERQWLVASAPEGRITHAHPPPSREEFDKLCARLESLESLVKALDPLAFDKLLRLMDRRGE